MNFAEEYKDGKGSTVKNNADKLKETLADQDRKEYARLFHLLKGVKVQLFAKEGCGGNGREQEMFFRLLTGQNKKSCVCPPAVYQKTAWYFYLPITADTGTITQPERINASNNTSMR